MNVGTIIRNQNDGRWHEAMPTWDAIMGDLLQAQSVSAGESGKGLGVVGWVAAVLGVVLLGVMILSNRRRELSVVAK